MTVSSGGAPQAPAAPRAAEPLLQSVRTFLSEPHKLLVHVPPPSQLPQDTQHLGDVTIAPDTTYLQNHNSLLKRNDLNNNSKNKFLERKNPEERRESSGTGAVDASGMPSQAERMQRQPLLARCIKRDTCLNVSPPEESDPDPEDGPAPPLPNGDFQIEIPPVGREERFPKEIWKTVISFLFLFCCVTINMLSLALTHERVPDRTTYGPLPDTFLDNVAPIEWALSASEILIMLSTATSAAVVVFHKHRFIVARRIFLIVGLLYLYRSITMYVTVLPVSSTTYYCSPKSNHTTPLLIFERMVYLFSGFGLSINGKHIYCGDSIYSGHTMILVLSYLIIAEYSPRRGLALHWAAGAAAAAGVLLILLAHAHYVVDVLIAYYITTRLFWTYHTLAARPMRHGTPGMISREWWFFFFSYLEKNVRGPVPRQYNWPLPWPKAKLFSRLS